MTPFPCTACGMCCRNVHKSEQTAFLDRGDGTCWHFDENTNLCTIYDDRPLICQIEHHYRIHFKDKMDWETFVNLNFEVCHQLQNQRL